MPAWFLTAQAQASLWETWRNKPEHVKYVRHLDISTACDGEKLIERVGYILRLAENLKSIYISLTLGDRDGGGENIWRALSIFEILARSLQCQPELTLGIFGCGKPAFSTRICIQELLRLKDKLLVMAIHTKPSEQFDPLIFLPRFHQLRELHLDCNGQHYINALTDLAVIFKDINLEILSLYPCEEVKSFPLTIQDLRLLNPKSTLSCLTWAAACDLYGLVELTVECLDTEISKEQHFQFKSTNLRVVDMTLGAAEEATLTRQIIDPIFSKCRSLESIQLTLKTSLSSPTLERLTCSNSSLTSLSIKSAANSITFEELIDRAKHIPNLKSLTLPWPSTIGTRSNNYGQQVSWLSPERYHGNDVPHRLNFSQACLLSLRWPKLRHIEFEIDSKIEARNGYYTWSEFKTWRRHAKTLYPTSSPSMKEYWMVLQLFKMDRFIDGTGLSPCLDICTVFSQLEGTHTVQDRSMQRITLSLSLDQVRKHKNP